VYVESDGTMSLNGYDDIVAEVSNVGGEVAAKQDKITATGAANLLTAPASAGGQPGTKPAADFATAAQGAKADTALQSADAAEIKAYGDRRLPMYSGSHAFDQNAGNTWVRFMRVTGAKDPSGSIKTFTLPFFSIHNGGSAYESNGLLRFNVAQTADAVNVLNMRVLMDGRLALGSDMGQIKMLRVDETTVDVKMFMGQFGRFQTGELISGYGYGGALGDTIAIDLGISATDGTGDVVQTTLDSRLPHTWPAGVEISFGNSLFGKRWSGSSTLSAPGYSTVNVGGLGTGFVLVSCGGAVRNLPLGHTEVEYGNSSSLTPGAGDSYLKCKVQNGSGTVTWDYNVWALWKR
jgi:hypothetical protein